MGKPWENGRKIEVYPLVHRYSYGKITILVRKTTRDGLFSIVNYVSLLEGILSISYLCLQVEGISLQSFGSQSMIGNPLSQ